MKLKTDLLTAVTDNHGCIDKFNHGAFDGVFNIGLVLGSQDVESRRYPTDDKGLDTLKYSLDSMVYRCLAGLSGIGGFVGAANLVNLGAEDFENLGIAIQNMAQLGIEAQNHLKGIEMDIKNRRESVMTEDNIEPEPLTEEV